MECHKDLIFFLLERAKCLLQKYIREFGWEWFFEGHTELRTQDPEKLFRNFFEIRKKILY